MKHVERALPTARHVELDCGHVPQVEASAATHAAVSKLPGLAAQRSRSSDWTAPWSTLPPIATPGGVST